MAQTCREHPHEVAEGLCRSCGLSFCADCLVYPFGAGRPPYCIPCAIAAGGVRRTARNPVRIESKEKKRRLKEWRKARKRDLDGPAPDGVAAWHQMAEADGFDQAELDAGRAAAEEREALRLPPPVPETPTPPPDVNLAPPGPAGTDWRDGIDLPAELNFGAPGSSGALGPLPADTPSADVPAPRPLPVPPEPVAMEAFTPAPLDPGALGLESTTAPPPPGPAGTTMATAGPDPYDTGGFAAAPFEPSPPESHEPSPYDTGGFEPAPFEPEPDPRAAVPVTIDMGADPLSPSFGRAQPMTSFGMDDDPLPPPPPPPPATTAPVAPPAPSRPPEPPVRSHHPAPPPPPPLDPPAGSGIRPRTPTRIPAAVPEGPSSGEAKALLDRIAALRAKKD